MISAALFTLQALGLATLGGCNPSSTPVQQRHQMVALIEQRGVVDPVVLRAMGEFPRHELVPSAQRCDAYDDRPLPIGRGQTISQPYIVAVMTEAARIKPGDKVLEIGTGSGYQAAILALVGARVFSIEIVSELSKRAQADLARLGVEGITFRAGDGYAGWPDEAPFAAIVVTAAPQEAPRALLEQLAVGGRLVIPVGAQNSQSLQVHTRTPTGYAVENVFPVRFVPMTSESHGTPEN